MYTRNTFWSRNRRGLRVSSGRETQHNVKSVCGRTSAECVNKRNTYGGIRSVNSADNVLEETLLPPPGAGQDPTSPAAGSRSRPDFEWWRCKPGRRRHPLPVCDSQVSCDMNTDIETRASGMRKAAPISTASSPIASHSDGDIIASRTLYWKRNATPRLV